MTTAKKLSRGQRWNILCNEAREGLNKARSAFEGLVELQGEFQDWYDGMPESLQSGATGDKLQAICDLQLDGGEIDELERVLDEAESAETPLGFGRD